MPDNKLVSLPIPASDDNRYSDLIFDNEKSYFDIMKQLKPTIREGNGWNELTPETHCHVDPDIFESIFLEKLAGNPALDK